jgi:predicted Fe-Mo cluster-binding NifX family protein
MRIAIANWDDRVSPVLDSAASLTVIELGAEGETGRRVVRLEDSGVSGRVRQIGGLGLAVLICGALSRPLHEALSSQGMEVVPFVAGDVARVLSAFVRGELPHPALTLPGCRCRWRGRGCEAGSGGQGPARRNWSSPAERKPAPGVVPNGLQAKHGAAMEPLPIQTNQGEAKMVVISARGETLDAAVDSRFGRAAFFLAVDVESGTARAYSNQPNLEAAQGAGIQAAETVARLGPEAVVTGNVGPKAFRVLQAAGIKMYLCGETTVAEAVRQFKAGELTEASAANVAGHWG